MAHPFALARWLQEAAVADALDAGTGADGFWIIRRLTIALQRLPTYPEELELRTRCTAIGKSVAERRTTVVGPAGTALDAEAIWAHVDPRTRRPKRLSESFHAIYGQAAGERRPRSSLRHPASAPDDADGLPWTFPAADVDLAGHISNIAYWRLAAEHLEVPRAGPALLEAEFRAGLAAGPATIRRRDRMLWVSDQAGTPAATLTIVPGPAELGPAG